MIIKEVYAHKVKDSREDETIEVSVNGLKASSPSGKSTGKYETAPYNKRGIDWNINYLNAWNTELEINSFDDLYLLEQKIKKNLKLKDVKDFGANALFAFESAVLKALAKEKKKELWELINSRSRRFPTPVGNVLGGGVHSHNLPKPYFQEFLIIPHEKKFVDNIRIMNSVYEKIGDLVLGRRKKNDEGAWETNFKDEEVFDLINKVRIEKNNFYVGVDMASSTFFKKNKYRYGRWFLDKIKQMRSVETLIMNHDLFYIEDPMREDDFEGFSKINKKFRNKLIVGDDLTATQIDRVKKAIKMKSINSMIIKPNQNGSLLEVREIVRLCKLNGIKTIMSHRSGETMDNALADYSFGFQTDYIKCGISGKEREVKLRRMCEIEKGFL